VRALLALLLAAVLAGDARAASLSATRFGPVDFGDRVAYRVGGGGCARAAVRVRVVAGPERRAARGAATRGRADAGGGCRGIARVPGFRAVRRTGWEQGDRIRIALVSRAGRVPLRYARMEADEGAAAAGSPEVVPAGDQDTIERDRAVAMDPGDAVALGRVDLRRTQALAVRLCIDGQDTSAAPPNLGPFLTPERVEPTTFLSVRQDGPDGAALVGPVDVASDLQELSRLSTLGSGGCYRLVVLPLTGRRQEAAPRLFLRAESGRPGILRVNTVDVVGTGAKLPVRPPRRVRGMRTIFDGRSFDGWEMQDCVLRDGAAVNARGANTNDISGCSLTYERPLRDVVLRFRMRRENIYDNAGIYLGAQEIQLRSIGEYLPGGYFGQFAARWVKLNSFPFWDEIEVVQLGARHVVTVNGRTVTDVLREGGPPEPYRLNLIAQPQWSYRAGAELGFGSEGDPGISDPSALGAFWFKNVRLLECDGRRDPRCRRLAEARRGQVPVPDGAPAWQPR
jgi:hypothetical protein